MLLEYEQAQAIAHMLAYGYYKKKLPVINKYFRRSRNFLKHFDMFVNAVQVGQEREYKIRFESCLDNRTNFFAIICGPGPHFNREVLNWDIP